MLPVYGLDFETDTSIILVPATSTTPAQTSGLDPNIAGITSVSVSAAGEDFVFDVDTLGSERRLITELGDLLAYLPAGIVSTWNGAVFDLPFVDTRRRILGARLDLVTVYDPSIEVKYAPTPGHRGGVRASLGHHRHVDIQPHYKQVAHDLGVKWSLKPVATALGIEMVELDRTRMHTYTPAQVRAYVASDTRGTRALALELPDLESLADRVVLA